MQHQDPRCNSVRSRRLARGISQVMKMQRVLAGGLCAGLPGAKRQPGKCFDVGGCRSRRRFTPRRRGRRLSAETIWRPGKVGFPYPLDVIGIGPTRCLGERDAGGETTERAGGRDDGADLEYAPARRSSLRKIWYAEVLSPETG